MVQAGNRANGNGSSRVGEKSTALRERQHSRGDDLEDDVAQGSADKRIWFCHARTRYDRSMQCVWERQLVGLDIMMRTCRFLNSFEGQYWIQSLGGSKISRWYGTVSKPSKRTEGIGWLSRTFSVEFEIPQGHHSALDASQRVI